MVELILAIVTLALMTTVVSTLYIGGIQSSHSQEKGMLLDSALRGKMESLISSPFDSLINGSAVLSIEGDTYTISWIVSLIDLNGDALPEAAAKKIIIRVDEDPDRSLSLIVVNHEGRVGKL